VGIVLALGCVVLIFLLLQDGFETMVLPRRVSRAYRWTRLYFRTAWQLWRFLASFFPAGKRHNTFLSLFGPLSLLGLFATWAIGLIFAFGALHWSLGTLDKGPDDHVKLFSYVYFSGVTFFTVGYGDLFAAGWLGRLLSVVEAGTGFSFLAIVIGYVPVVYGAFSRREVTISMLDARAGSPPTAAQLVLRYPRGHGLDAANTFLAEWERWSAEVLESHLSFPVLSFYRSQHDNQSWLAALTMILDTCTLLLTVVKGADVYQAQLTFAMARHVVVDMAQVFGMPPRPPKPDRLANGQCERLREVLLAAGLPVREGPEVLAKAAELRGMYEPFLNGLSQYFELPLPPFVPEKPPVDNWQTSAWMRRTEGIGRLPGVEDDHYD
jgi:hypothetical protein